MNIQHLTQTIWLEIQFADLQMLNWSEHQHHFKDKMFWIFYVSGLGNVTVLCDSNTHFWKVRCSSFYLTLSKIADLFFLLDDVVFSLQGCC